MFDFNHPFFQPVWRRILIVVICLGWAAFEFSTGAAFWGVMFTALGFYAGWKMMQIGGSDE